MAPEDKEMKSSGLKPGIRNGQKNKIFIFQTKPELERDHLEVSAFPRNLLTIVQVFAQEEEDPGCFAAWLLFSPTRQISSPASTTTRLGREKNGIQTRPPMLFGLFPFKKNVQARLPFSPHVPTTLGPTSSVTHLDTISWPRCTNEASLSDTSPSGRSFSSSFTSNHKALSKAEQNRKALDV